MFRIALVLILISTTAWGSIGEITASTGPGTIKRQEDKITGDVGTGLEMQDAISTQNGAWQLEFEDETRVDVTEHSRMVIDEFIYDPASGKGALSMKATLGAVRYASGQIAKNSRQRVNIRTPSATINVRGTDFMMIVDEIGGSMITLLPSCEIDAVTQDTRCEVGEISVESDVGTVIMNQAFETTVVKSRWDIPAKPVILSLPDDMLRAMLIVRKKQPYDVEIEKQYPVTNLLDIDFLKYDELDRDPLVEGIKKLWVTDLDNDSYLRSAFVDEMERQLQEILAKWIDELSSQNIELFAERERGLDPETNIFYDEDPNFIVSRKEGSDHFFKLDLYIDNSYTIDIEQGDFYAYGYRAGIGGANNITITQRR
jgi:hypothetical protein